MTITDFLLLCVSVFSLLAIGWIIYASKHPWPVVVTVEQERAQSIEVQQAIGQHHPTVGDIDQWDDPLYHVIHFCQEVRATSGL